MVLTVHFFLALSDSPLSVCATVYLSNVTLFHARENIVVGEAHCRTGGLSHRAREPVLVWLVGLGTDV